MTYFGMNKEGEENIMDERTKLERYKLGYYSFIVMACLMVIVIIGGFIFKVSIFTSEILFFILFIGGLVFTLGSIKKGLFILNKKIPLSILIIALVIAFLVQILISLFITKNIQWPFSSEDILVEVIDYIIWVSSFFALSYISIKLSNKFHDKNIND